MEEANESYHPMQCLHGDVLESVLLRLPSQDLAMSATLVSSEWRNTARSAIRRRRRHRQCASLVVHLQGARVCRSTHVYDPLNQSWAAAPSADVLATALPPLPVRRCAGGGRLYTLSLACLTLSLDALGTAWREVTPPQVWRVDPVVALVGPSVVVLGGACGAANGSTVEVHDEEAGAWTACAPMPAVFDGSASATRLSAAASRRRVYVVERRSGWASWFEPGTRQWGPILQLLPNGGVSAWAVGVGGGERLVLAGLKRQAEGVAFLLWSANGETLEVGAEGGAAMPEDMAGRLFGAPGADTASIGLCAAAAGGYVYNASEPRRGAVRYELAGGEAAAPEAEGRGSFGGVERWEWVACPQAVEESDAMAMVLFGCRVSASD